MLNPSPTLPAVKIAIIRTTSIGDVVLATACLDLLSSPNTPVEITWVGRNSLQLIRSALLSVRAVELNPERSNSSEEVVEALKDIHVLVDFTNEYTIERNISCSPKAVWYSGV